MTLMELLQLFEDVDNGIAELSREDAEKLKDGLSDKVDAYHEVISRMKSEDDRLKAEAEEIAKARQSVQRARDRVKELLLYVMKSKDYKKLPGERYSAQIVEKKTQRILRQPDEMDYMKHQDYVKVAFKWDATKLKAEAKTNDELKELVADETTEYVKFSVRKDI